MKKVLGLMSLVAFSTLASLELNDAYTKIPTIAQDQAKVMDVLWEIAPSNRPIFVAHVEDAFRKYPVSDYERTNMLNRLSYYCQMFTNSTPTTVLNVDWHQQLKNQQLMKLGEVNVRSGNMIEDAMPLDEAIVTVPWNIGAIPRASLSKEKKAHEDKPYPGQTLKAF